MGFLSAIIGAFDPISRIADSIAKARIAAANAQTDREKIAAEERVKGLEARRDVLMAESGSRVNAFMRAALAAGPTVYLGKIFIWDKALGLGKTDPLTPELWQVVMAVVGFYFLYEAVTAGARILRK